MGGIVFLSERYDAGCTQEACSFRDLHADFEQEDIVVLGVSADDVQSHRKLPINMNCRSRCSPTRSIP